MPALFPQGWQMELLCDNCKRFLFEKRMLVLRQDGQRKVVPG